MKNILLLGFGGFSWQDDAIAHVFLNEIYQLDIPGITVDRYYETSLGKAGLIAQYDIVIFIDACLWLPGKRDYALFTCVKQNMIYFKIIKSTFCKNIINLLNITQKEFRRDPKAYIFLMKGHQFAEGVGLSDEAKRIVKDSVEYLRPILETKSFAHAWDKK